jgi:protein SCO1/2
MGGLLVRVRWRRASARATPAGMRRRRRPALAAAIGGVLVAVGLFAAGCAAPKPAADPGGYRGTVLDPPFAMPALAFTDTAGQRFDLATATGRPLTLVFFGYTNCPDVCPTVLADVAAAKRQMPAEQRAHVGLVFITTDPRRDNPRTIRAYLDRFDPSFVGLTGPIEDIKRAAGMLSVAVEPPVRQPGGGYTTDHGSSLIGFGPNGVGRLLWTAGTSVGDLSHDFVRFVAARP